MHFQIKTDVDASFDVVVKNFDQTLLKKVSPPFPPTRLLRYDGNKPGDEVHVELNFIFFRQVWESKIISLDKNDEHMIFVDEGIKLPFFLAYWHHEHSVEKRAHSSCIIDNVTFCTPARILDFLLYPIMYLQFWYRKPQYRKFFRSI